MNRLVYVCEVQTYGNDPIAHVFGTNEEVADFLERVAERVRARTAADIMRPEVVNLSVRQVRGNPDLVRALDRDRECAAAC